MSKSVAGPFLTAKHHGGGLGPEAVTVCVQQPPGLRVDIKLGVGGETLYLEAYDWRGRPVRFVSTTTGEPINTHQDLVLRPHPELAIYALERRAAPKAGGID